MQLLFLSIRRLSQRPLVVLPLSVMVLYALYLPLAGYGEQLFDSSGYWGLGWSFIRQRRFHLLYFDNPLRGYLWPLVLLIYRLVLRALHMKGVEMIPMGVGLATALWGGVLPALWRSVQPDADPYASAGSVPLATTIPPVAAWRHLILVGLGFAFWRGYFAFALSDVPSLLAILGALLLIFAMATRRLPAGWALLAGGLAAAAVNIRPVFLLSTGFLLGAAAWEWLRAYGRRAAAVRLCLFAVGMGLVVVPQWGINQQRFGVSTPLVLGWQTNTTGCSLYLDQLSWGLGTQRYETSTEANRSAQMFFGDPAGQAIADAEHIVSKPSISCVGFKTTAQVLAVFGRHWPALVPLYARHVFNGLDQHQPMPYLEKLRPQALLLMALNYSLWFALVLLLWRGRLGQRLLRRRALVVLLVLLVPCAAVVPTAIEPRFLLPAHVLAYTTLAYGWPATWTLRAGWAHRLRLPVLVAYVGWLVGCFALANDVYSHLNGWPPLKALLLN